MLYSSICSCFPHSLSRFHQREQSMTRSTFLLALSVIPGPNGVQMKCYATSSGASKPRSGLSHQNSLWCCYSFGNLISTKEGYSMETQHNPHSLSTIGISRSWKKNMLQSLWDAVTQKYERGLLNSKWTIWNREWGLPETFKAACLSLIYSGPGVNLLQSLMPWNCNNSCSKLLNITPPSKYNYRRDPCNVAKVCGAISHVAVGGVPDSSVTAWLSCSVSSARFFHH